jgi:GAF domain-containing protein/HAMP domain-containing protein
MEVSPALPGDQQPPELSNPNAGITAIAAVMTALCALLGLVFLILALQRQDWQYYTLVGAYFQTAIFGLAGIIYAPRGRYGLKGIGYLSGSFALTSILTAIMLEGVTLPVAIIYLVFALIVTAIIAAITRGALTIVLGLLTATAVALFGTYVQQYQIPTPQANIIVPGLLGIVIMVYIALLAILYVSSPLQVRLTSTFLAVVIIPLAISSVIQSQVNSNRLRTETLSSLQTAADEVAIVLDNFVSSNLEIITNEADNPAFSNYLSLPNYDPDQLEPKQNMQAALKLLNTRESAERKFLSSYALLNKNGKNIYDTMDDNIGANEAATDYFNIPMQTGKPYYSPVMFDENGNAYIYFSAPVKGQNRQEIVGVLRSRYNALVLQRLAATYSRLITFFSHVVILDENLIRLADDYQPVEVFTPVVDLSLDQELALKAVGRMPLLPTGVSLSSNPELARFLNISKRGDTAYIELDSAQENSSQLPEMIALSTTRLQPWKVIYLKANLNQKQLEQQQVQTSTLVASIMALLVGLVAIGASKLLAGPISELTQTARQISSGNLGARAQHVGSDEFGTLGTAFNLMTDRLRLFIGELEDRVLQRTYELEGRNEALMFRSTQLQTVAEVARNIVTSQDLEELLNSVSELISSRFGYYHVGIFLLDENKLFAVLRAANSEGGKRMLNRKHMLQVGKVGIVGNVTGTGEPRIATDVGEDAVFFNNPDLPLTRSEMALPLRVSGQVIGALDVQSTESNAFSGDDISLFATLADQVAIAIYNSQLYAETSRALAESQALHRQYLRQEWQAEIATRHNRAYRFTPQGLAPSEPVIIASALPETYQSGDPVAFNEVMPDGSTQVIMEVPIYLRGEMIGAIRLQDQGENRSWSEDETQAVKDVAQQVGIAMETARLFEKTMQRADRERKVLEITSRIRATNDPQEMLEIAATELQRVLGATRAQIFLRPGDHESGKPSSNGSNGAE